MVEGKEAGTTPPAPVSSPSPEPPTTAAAPAFQFDWEALKSFRPQDKIQCLLQEYRKVESSEGTVVRKFFGDIRTTVNGTVNGLQSKVNEVQTSVKEKVEEIAPVVKKFEAEFTSFDDFRTKHRGLTIGGVALVVALPSAIGGRRRALYNGLLAAGATAAFLGLLDINERRISRKKGEDC